LKNEEQFSTIFDIIPLSSLVDASDSDSIPQLKPLQQQMQRALLKEKILMEERIQRYENTQRQEFINLFNKTQQDRNALFASIRQHLMQHKTKNVGEMRKFPSYTDLHNTTEQEIPSRMRSKSMEPRSPSSIIPVIQVENDITIGIPEKVDDELSRSMPSMIFYLFIYIFINSWYFITYETTKEISFKSNGD
jgi:hypothetical protein